MIGHPGETPAPPSQLPPYCSFSQALPMPIPAFRGLAIDALRLVYGSRGFLKDDLPSEASGAQKFAQELGRRSCRRYARQRGTLAGVSNSPIWSTICDPYLNSINEGPITDGNYGPIYPGGQCIKSYVFERRSVSYNGDTRQILTDSTNTFGPYQGPLTWQRIADVDTSTILQKRLQLTHANGNIIFITYFYQKPPLRPDYGTVTIFNIRRTDGQPDNCGNQPGNDTYSPPIFPPNLPSLPSPTNPAPGVSNNWEVNILPDGQINFCIAGDCSGGIPPDGGGGPDSGGGPGQPDGDPRETNPNDPNDPNEVSGCVEDGNILTGLKIEVTQAPPNYQGLGDIYYKSCWVWMGPSSDLLDMVIDGRTLESGQFVIPDSNDCTCFKVRANPGFKVSVQAYSRPKEE